MKKVQRGFTLIELLIVIAILGILAAIAIPALSRYIKSSQLQAANTEVSILKTSISAYSADNNGDFPNTTAQLGNYTSGVLTGSYTLNGTDGNITVGTGWPFIWGDGKWVKP